MNLALGGFLAVSAHKQLMQAESAVANRWFRDAVVFGLFVMMPTGIFFYLNWPDWSWLYWVDPAKLGDVATPLVWLAYPVSVALGFALAAVFVRGDSPRVSLAVPAVGLIALAVISGVFYDRFLHDTVYADYNNMLIRLRGMPWMWSDTTWVAAMLGTGMFAGLPFAYLFTRNLREGRAGFLPPAKPL